jgi:hypothetical protein
MKRSLILISSVAVILAVGGCASDSKKPDTASAATAKKSSRPWWKIPKSWRTKKEDEPWVYGQVRKGKGLLSDDEDGFVVYKQSERGSADPTKPEKVRR